MRKVNLNMEENNKYEVIKKLVDSGGNKKAAAIKLNCSIRTINRLINRYKREGKAAFIHGNKGKVPSISINPSLRNEIIDRYINDYGDTNFVHFTEIIQEDLGIRISDTTLNNWLRDVNILSPKAWNKTKKSLKKELQDKLKTTSSKKVQNSIKQTIDIIDSKVAHPTRPRSKYFGEMIQMDASSFEWVKDSIWHLHLAIDDATGEVVGAFFDAQETLNGYYNVLYQILTNYGIPAMFYTDKRTVFEYRRKDRAFDDEDTFTQFSYACHNLGINIKTTSVAQAKGRVERLNQTFQSRLPVELRRACIHTIGEANEFLKSYLKKFNEQFALHLNNTQSVFEKQPSLNEINTILAVLSPRKIDAGHCIHFKNKVYIPVTERNIDVHIKKKTSCMVIEAFDKNLYVNVLDRIYALREIPLHELSSKEFDEPTNEKKKKKIYIPPLSHPWKQASFLLFKSKNSYSNSRANI